MSEYSTRMRKKEESQLHLGVHINVIKWFPFNRDANRLYIGGQYFIHNERDDEC